jgi:hypothetical protein
MNGCHHSLIKLERNEELEQQAQAAYFYRNNRLTIANLKLPPARPPALESHGGKRKLIIQMDCGNEIYDLEVHGPAAIPLWRKLLNPLIVTCAGLGLHPSHHFACS